MHKTGSWRSQVGVLDLTPQTWHIWSCSPGTGVSAASLPPAGVDPRTGVSASHCSLPAPSCNAQSQYLRLRSAARGARSPGLPPCKSWRARCTNLELARWQVSRQRSFLIHPRWASLLPLGLHRAESRDPTQTPAAGHSAGFRPGLPVGLPSMWVSGGGGGYCPACVPWPTPSTRWRPQGLKVKSSAWALCVQASLLCEEARATPQARLPTLSGRPGAVKTSGRAHVSPGW